MTFTRGYLIRKTDLVVFQSTGRLMTHPLFTVHFVGKHFRLDLEPRIQCTQLKLYGIHTYPLEGPISYKVSALYIETLAQCPTSSVYRGGLAFVFLEQMVLHDFLSHSTALCFVRYRH